MRRERDRRRLLVARSLLRLLLGLYLDRPAATVALARGAHGKPMLAEDSALRFSVAHSHELALYAVAEATEVGVDVELLRPVPRALALAERYFAQAEAKALLGLAGSALDEAFLECWTRKEAYVKARGEGLAIELETFDAHGATVGGDEPDAAAFSVRGIRPQPGYVAAVAAKGSELKLRARGEVRAGGEIRSEAGT
jgi:4'-phosphopantetheinyl transferase